MKKISKYTVYLVLASLVCVGLQKFCRSKTDGFAMYKISSQLAYNADFDTQPLPPNEMQSVLTILDQPFYYLGKGAQCYAFASKDGKYVLKFFRLYQLRAPEWFARMPLPSFLESYRNEKIKRKFGEFFRDFMSYKIAFDLLKQDTGLMYAHLNKTHHLKKKVILFDKINVKHCVDLDSMEFLLQKKADLFYPALEKLIQQGKKEQVKDNIRHLVLFLAKRSSLGIYDKDPDINTNFGICEDRPLQIDVGRFRPDPSRKDPLVYIDDIVRVTDNLQQWLEKHDKELSDHLLQEIQNLKIANQLSA